MEFWNSSGVKGFEIGILQGYNHEKHVSSTGGVRILNGIAQVFDAGWNFAGWEFCGLEFCRLGILQVGILQVARNFAG